MKDASFPSSFDVLPSYSESAQTSSLSTLFYCVNQTRTSNIQALISTYIHPHLHACAISGLTKTTLILIPSNVSSLQPRLFSLYDRNDSNGIATDSKAEDNFLGETIIGFPASENLSLVRLHGAGNTLEFWRQEAVIRELGMQLKDDLRKGGHHILEDAREGSEELTGPRGSRGSTKKSAEWRSTNEVVVGPGQVKVGVKFQEVALRVENTMRLFETRNGKAVVVRVEVGG